MTQYYTLTVEQALAQEPIVVGRSKVLYHFGSDCCLVRLIPSLNSFTYARDELVPGTEVLRLDFYELAAQQLANAGIVTAFRERLGSDLYAADYCSEIPFEVIVKNVAVGSTLRKYPGLFPQNHQFGIPVVKFDYRIDPEDQPIADDYIREAGCQPEQLKAIALSTNAELKRWLSPNVLMDFCIVIGQRSDGMLAISSEISPDCMRLQSSSGSSLDKDLFRYGASHNTITAVWTELVQSLRNQL